MRDRGRGRHLPDTGSRVGDAGPRDVLSDALKLIAFRGVALNVLELNGPWAIEASPAAEIGAWLLPGATHVIAFHIVVDGPIWASLLGGGHVELADGDLVALPFGDPHIVATQPDRRPVRIDLTVERVRADELPVVIRRGDRGAPARMICGFVGCDRRPFDGLLGSLPRMFAVPAAGAADASLRSALRAAIDQAWPARTPGSGEVVARLTELVFVDALRRYLATAPTDTGWLAAVHDPVVGAAIASIHRDPARAWTVESLARAAGASRTVLADRFVRLLGVPPMQYAARWRIELAAHRLRETGTGIEEIAASVGYASPAAFHRAFTRLVGTTPARWRRRPE